MTHARATRATGPTAWPPEFFKAFVLLGTVATAALLAASCSPSVGSGSDESPSGFIDSVVDGDTVIVSIGGGTETVRLLGIDTPEKSDSLRAAECFGDEARDLAQALLPEGTPVVLSRDVESRDQYGRLLAHVHRQDGLHVNLAMLQAGAASPLFFAPNRAMRAEFEAAADAARKSWIGFWAACGADDVVLQPLE